MQYTTAVVIVVALSKKDKRADTTRSKLGFRAELF
jgi:hypothetical protein